VERVEVTELRDGAFVAELAVTGPQGDRRLDTRPSDAIALALRMDAPMFMSDAVLDVAGTVPDQTLLEQDDIDEQVAAFRSELDELDPADFGLHSEAEPTADADLDDSDDQRSDARRRREEPPN
jgi:hypothetical protein